MEPPGKASRQDDFDLLAITFDSESLSCAEEVSSTDMSIPPSQPENAFETANQLTDIVDSDGEESKSSQNDHDSESSGLGQSVEKDNFLFTENDLQDSSQSPHEALDLQGLLRRCEGELGLFAEVNGDVGCVFMQHLLSISNWLQNLFVFQFVFHPALIHAHRAGIASLLRAGR
jgi:hypothetical protein